MDSALEKYAGKMIFIILCVSALMIVGVVVFLRSSQAIGFALGIVMAAGLNIVKVILLKYTVNRVTNMESGAASGFTGVSYIIRFILTGLTLVAGHFLPVVELLGVALGLLAMPIATYCLNFYIKRDYSDTQ